MVNNVLYDTEIPKSFFKSSLSIMGYLHLAADLMHEMTRFLYFKKSLFPSQFLITSSLMENSGKIEKKDFPPFNRIMLC